MAKSKKNGGAAKEVAQLAKAELDSQEWRKLVHSTPGMEAELGRLQQEVVAAIEQAREFGPNSAARGQLKLVVNLEASGDEGMEHLRISYKAEAKYPVQRSSGKLIGTRRGSVRFFEEFPEVAEARKGA